MLAPAFSSSETTSVLPSVTTIISAESPSCVMTCKIKLYENKRLLPRARVLWDFNEPEVLHIMVS